MPGRRRRCSPDAPDLALRARPSLPTPTARVLVVASAEACSCDVRGGLAEAGYRVEAARSARDAVRRATAHAFDAYVVDGQLLRGSGRRLVARLRARGLGGPLLALTWAGTVAERVAALEAGADDTLPGPVAPEELAARVRAKLRWRARTVGGRAVAVGPLTLDVGCHRATVEGPGGRAVLRLRRKEFAMLHVFMRDAGAMVPRAVLADRVWGEGVHVSRNTFDVTLSGLRQRLGEGACSSGAAGVPWIETVRGAGYRLVSAGRFEG